MGKANDDLISKISDCGLCTQRFAATRTAHAPRPVVWFREGAPVLIAGQAPGARVHASARPFTDASGDRLRDWMGVDESVFYDRARVAIVPMAFCFPGYNAKGSDLPPPAICARTWRRAVINKIGRPALTLLVGGYAQRWHLGDAAREGVSKTVAAWRDHAPTVFPLPHPSWRNNAWIAKNPWFAHDLLPNLRARVTEVLA